jgi:hypothetical protein
MPRMIAPFALIAATLLPAYAHADVTATYRGPSGPMIIEADLSDTVRLTIDAGRYALLRDQRLYLSEMKNGKAVVTDLGELATALGPSSTAAATAPPQARSHVRPPGGTVTETDELRVALDSLRTAFAHLVGATGPSLANATGASPIIEGAGELTALSTATIAPERFTLAAVPRDTTQHAEDIRKQILRGNR